MDWWVNELEFYSTMKWAIFSLLILLVLGLILNLQTLPTFQSKQLYSIVNQFIHSFQLLSDRAGKRPMSSMCPAIFINNSTAAGEQVRLVVGAAGGSRIISAVASVSTRVLFFGENIKQVCLWCHVLFVELLTNQ